MMNIQSTNAADAAASSNISSAGKKGADKGEGFSDALNEFDQDAVGNKGTAKQAGNESDVVDQDAAAAEETPTKSKPIIDIRPESLRKPTLSLQQANFSRQVISAKEALTNEPARELTAGEKKLKDALALAKALTANADALEGAKGGANVEGDDQELDALLAADDSDLELGDILTLLNGHGAAAALESMAPGQKGQVATGKRGQGENDVGRVKSDVTSAMSALSNVSGEADAPALPGGSEMKSEQDRLFRFQGAKGDRQTMDMAVGESRGERTAEFRTSNGGQAETVTVLDSRRFIGLAPNASALTSALSGDGEWVRAMQSSSAAQNIAAQNSTGGVVNTLKLQMTPHDLGSVTAMLRLQGEQLNVHLTVETRAAYRQLSDDSGGIVDALRSQGFAVDQVTISIAPTADSDAANNQQNGQQASAQGERQGSAAGRGQENAGGRQSSQDTAGNGNDVAQENPAAPSDGSARPGQLYL